MDYDGTLKSIIMCNTAWSLIYMDVRLYTCTLLTSMGLQLVTLATPGKFHLMAFLPEGSSQVKYIISLG